MVSSTVDWIAEHLGAFVCCRQAEPSTAKCHGAARTDGCHRATGNLHQLPPTAHFCQLDIIVNLSLLFIVVACSVFDKFF